MAKQKFIKADSWRKQTVTDRVLKESEHISKAFALYLASEYFDVGTRSDGIRRWRKHDQKDGSASLKIEQCYNLFLDYVNGK